MFGLSLAQILVRIAAFAIIIGVHGLVLAGLARLLGDRGPAHDGRLTANPLVHLDLIGLVVALASRTGWIKPIDMDPAAMRLGRAGLVLCAVGALVATVVFGLIMLRLRGPAITVLGPGITTYVLLVLNAVGDMSVWFAVFNLIPLPPLTGGYVLAAITPAVARVLRRHTVWVGLALAALMIVTRGDWLRPAVDQVRAVLMIG